MPGRRWSGGRGAWVLVGFTALYVVATLLGRLSRPEEATTALAWPAAGVGVWFLLAVHGRARRIVAAVAVTASTAVVNVATGLPLLPSVLLGVVNAGHAVTGAFAVRASLGGRTALTEPGDVVRLLAASAGTAVLSGVAVALVATTLLGESFGAASVHFAVRNGGTTFVVLAAVLAVAPPYRPKDLVRAERRTTTVVVCLACAALFVVVFGSSGRPLLFLAMAAAVVAGTTIGVPRAGVLGLALSTGAVAGTVAGGGPLATVDDVWMRAVYVQLFTVVLMVVTLSLATLQRSRDELATTLAATVRQLEAAHDSALIGKALLIHRGDGSWTVARPNPALVTLLGQDPAGRSWREHLWPEDKAAVVTALEDLAAGRRTTWEAEVRHRRSDGEPVWTQVHVSALPAGDGPAAAVAEIVDISARWTRSRQLEERAARDALTGLRNRAGALEAIVRMLDEEGAAGAALLFLDLDDFKSVNDGHGHDAGDRLLVQVADALGRAVRDGDVAARLGGDEFVVCLPGVRDRSEADLLAARVRAEVRAALHLDGRPLGLDVSVGVALGEADDDPAALLRRADTAMYAVKFARRGGARHVRSAPTP